MNTGKMKKTIQINIAGIVFNIEEDAFETLKVYLDSIKNYFSSYDGSEEITADIEARIAEKFIGKNKTEDLPVIGADEVNKVIASMGTVADFEAIEEEEDVFATPTKAKRTTENTTSSESSRKVFRDGKRKALGGVLAGLANRFSVDVVWFRVLFLVLTLGLLGAGVGPFLILAYVICWIAFPVSNDLKEQENIKKFYRDNDQKVVAGVASGLASYFSLDVALIRVLFVVGGIFFGVGIIAYLVLWASSPFAERLTQRMEMKGEAVTIENIDTNIKQNLNVSSAKTPRNESAIATILLLPFRILGKLFQGLGQVLSKLGPVIRVVLGLFFTVWGLGLTIAAVVLTGVFFGAATDHTWFTNSEFGLFTRDLSPSSGIFLFLATALPGLAITILGIFFIGNKRVANRNFWLTGLGLWLLGVVGLAISGTKVAMNYAKDASVTEKEQFVFSGDVLYLDNVDNYENESFDFNTNVRIVKSLNGGVSVEKRFSASGRNREIAKQNAQNLTYNISQRDSLLSFDSRATLNPEDGFRNQKVHVTLRLPVGQKIRMSNEFADDLLDNSWSLRNKYGFDTQDFETLTFVLNPNGKLECEGCQELDEDAKKIIDSRRQGYHDDGDDREYERRDHFESKKFDLSGFTGVEVGGSFHVLINQGETFDVEVMAERDRDLEDLNLRVNGSDLDIDFEDRFFRNRGKVLVYITMPNLESLDISGASHMKVMSFENIKDIDIDISGASNAKLDIEAADVRLKASGASTLELRGAIENIDVDISGASRLRAQKTEIGQAEVSASGASDADFGKVGNLSSSTSGASHVSRN
ncbi:MAG: phage shock protein PspC (stress-responsive transcriptional regulator) [Arcticibacterium sp.]|jgi:phage shock protein PspC (stress-responsive transcriptional regulator)